MQNQNQLLNYVRWRKKREQDPQGIGNRRITRTHKGLMPGLYYFRKGI